MTQTIPVNPEVLKWARKTAGLSIEDVVHKLRRKTINKKIVAKWEEGESAPSYSQLELLAYGIYKRPLAIFFFPSPPEPEYQIESMPSQIRLLIRKAKVFQINLKELYDDKNPGSRQICQDLSFNPTVSPAVMAKTVREYLGVELSTQVGRRDKDQELKYWRKVFEENGIFVFKDAFKVDAFSGFCLYDQKFPIVYVNNSKSKDQQIVTLFHELAHLLFRTGGVDTGIEKYIEYLKKEFLASGDLASRQAYYGRKVKELSVSSKGGTRDSYYLIKTSYLGERYLSQAFSKYFQKQISLPQLADYLGENEKNIPGFERQFLKIEEA